MFPKLKAQLPVAIAVAALALALSAAWLGGPTPLLLVHRAQTIRSMPGEAPPATLAYCRRAAFLLHDITWAVACDKVGDDSAECTLPDDVAGGVNAVLDAEERRCLAAEALAEPVSAAPPSPPDAPIGRTARR